jgi:hypothetical protein
MAIAQVDGGISTAVANGANSQAISVVAGGSGKTTASDGGSAAAQVEADCKVQASASGSGSIAEGTCTLADSVITVQATKGSQAIGSDVNPPMCTPVDGGIAKVRSPMGDCG